MGGDNGEGFSGKSIKDTWTKPKGDFRIKGGKWGWLGKWRQLYFNNNFKNLKKKKKNRLLLKRKIN